jgi:hypothetical protein
MVAEVEIAGKESLGEVTADLHVSNTTGSQEVGGVVGRMTPKGGASELLKLTSIGYEKSPPSDLHLTNGKLYSTAGGTFWVKAVMLLGER